MDWRYVFDYYGLAFSDFTHWKLDGEPIEGPVDWDEDVFHVNLNSDTVNGFSSLYVDFRELYDFFDDRLIHCYIMYRPMMLDFSGNICIAGEVHSITNNEIRSNAEADMFVSAFSMLNEIKCQVN